MTWAWDDLKERAKVEREYLAMIHQQYIDEHLEFIPGCPCHPMTREARLALKALAKEAA
jgi:hypothetical protein